MKQPERTSRGRPPRDQKSTEESKKIIINTAKLLFSKDGYDGVSMRKIAELAHCSPAFLYKLFPSKRHILHNLWEDIFEHLADVMADCYQTAKPETRLKAICITYVDFWLSKPDDFRAIFLIEDQLQSEADDYFVESSKNLQRFDLLKIIITEAQQIGEIRIQDPALIQNLLFCTLQGLIMSLITIPEYSWGDHQALKLSLIDVLMKGLN